MPAEQESTEAVVYFRGDVNDIDALALEHPEYVKVFINYTVEGGIRRCWLSRNDGQRLYILADREAADLKEYFSAKTPAAPMKPVQGKEECNILHQAKKVKPSLMSFIRKN